MLAVNGHAKHRQSLCLVGYGKTALSIDLFFITTANILSTHTFLLLSLEFALRIPLAAAGVLAITHNKKCTQASLVHFLMCYCGKSGIQTHGTLKAYAGFRVRAIRSLWHLSSAKVQYFVFCAKETDRFLRSHQKCGGHNRQTTLAKLKELCQNAIFDTAPSNINS